MATIILRGRTCKLGAAKKATTLSQVHERMGHPVSWTTRGIGGSCEAVLVDVELLRMQAWVALDEDGLAGHLFHLLQPLCAR